MSRIWRIGLSTVCLAFLGSSAALAADEDISDAPWPQWRGPHRDGVSTEKGLLQHWATKGPPPAWKTTGLGNGYSSIAIAQDKLFAMGNRGNTVYLIARELQTGKPIWATPVGGQTSDHPASTPSVDDDLVFAVGPQGDVVCAQTADGKLVWRRSYVGDYGGKVPQWKFCDSPLVDGEKLICTPGSQDARSFSRFLLSGCIA